jgi:hypothetical protein
VKDYPAWLWLAVVAFLIGMATVLSNDSKQYAECKAAKGVLVRGYGLGYVCVEERKK